MASEQIKFWTDLAGEMGAPIFDGTLVAGLLSGQSGADPLYLMVLGVGLTGLGQ